MVDSYFWTMLPMKLNPIAFSIGFFSVRWYSLMYLLALATIYLLLRWRITNDPMESLPTETKTTSIETMEAFLLWSFLGLLIGARLGYFLFFDQITLFSHPLAIISPFQSGQYIGLYGMSFHGGLVGAVIAALLFTRKRSLDFTRLTDFLIPAIPLGYFWGRIGNFFNGEIYGKITSVPWGMVFPTDQLLQLRHPVQIYEALGEGLLLFIVLWTIRNRAYFKGKMLPFYLVLYGLVRFLLEFFRQPEAGQIILGLTFGQYLCLGMVIVGSVWCVHKKRLK